MAVSKQPRSGQLSRRDFLKLCGLLAMSQFAPQVLLLPQGQPRAVGARSEKPNVLVLVLDTLSAAHLAMSGYERHSTPNLERFARQALVYHNHWSAGNFTTPGTASLLTGVYPWSHRGIHTSGTIREAFLERNLFALLPEEYHRVAYTHNSLAMALLYRFQGHISQLLPFDALSLQENTASANLFWKDFLMADWAETILRGVNTPSASLFLSELDALRQRPAAEIRRQYGELFPLGIPSANYSRYFVMEDAIDWLIAELGHLPAPYFTYFHLMPPHEPYTPRKEFVDVFRDGKIFPAKPVTVFSDDVPEEKLNTVRQRYDEYLAYADAEFGRLYDALKQSGELENTYLILTSDHGQLFERGIHGHITPALYSPVLQVPLLVAKPGQKERQDIYDLTSATDLLPTLLHVLGAPVPEWIEGSVLPGLGGAGSPGREVFAIEAQESPSQKTLNKATMALVNDEYKLIHYFGYDEVPERFELYHLRDDPLEMNDLSAQMPGMVKDLQHRIDQAQKQAEARIAE